MNNLVNEFIKKFGKQKYDDIYEYLAENEILDKFTDIISKKNASPDELYVFAIKYGIFEIVYLLYVYKMIPFNFSIINQFYFGKSSDDEQIQDMLSTCVPVSGCDGDIFGGLNGKIEDKYSTNRNICINFMIEMKKYSSMKTKNCAFIYSIQPKHIYVIDKNYYP